MFINNTRFLSYCDAAEAWQLGTQDPATPIMEGMIFFHNYLMFYVIFIGVAVCYLLYKIVIHFNETTNSKPQKFTHSSILEIVWTIIPAVILIFIAVPSFALLYSLDELVEPALTVKIVGHQWYWSYEICDDSILTFSRLQNSESDDVESVDNTFNGLNFDSYMVPTDDLLKGSFRLLEVDNKLYLPTNTHIRLLITSADVLHSWAVPSLGIKVDACPGRLSQASLFIKRAGLFYGQCSEICGVNHAFMPIAIRGVDPSSDGVHNVFLGWATALYNGN